METIAFDLSKKGKTFKILNATNGGPIYKRHAADQLRSNFEDYKAARIPYSRNHDSNACSIYGGPFAHDITAIFPDFGADACAPSSYDFACTDESVLCCLEAGTKTFFRLGQTIEHQIKKHGTLPPEDFHKWAVICEHIIRHYNEGWANGFRLGMEYWEIWNEPDLDGDDSPNKRTWGGTKAQFFDLYEITAKHLKKLFPELKIGGPALAGDMKWGEDFLREMNRRNVPVDFFSWHVYGTRPEKVIKKADEAKALLVKYGYGNADSILNEWNYVKGWEEEYVYSIKAIHGIKGACFTAAVMCESQHSDNIDMLMYYDTRPSLFNGAFDFYSLEKLKGYYPLYWYGMFYDMQYEIPASVQAENVYSVCGIDKSGKTLAMIVCYSDDDNAPEKTIKVDFGRKSEYDVFLLDKNSDGESVSYTEDLVFTVAACSVLLIKEK